jgi:hypothetical protein
MWAEGIVRNDAGLAAAWGVLREAAMPADRADWESALLEQLMRRVQIVVEHHRHHEQPLDARQIVAYVLAEHERKHRGELAQIRSMLEEAVRSLIHGLR